MAKGAEVPSGTLLGREKQNYSVLFAVCLSVCFFCPSATGRKTSYFSFLPLLEDALDDTSTPTFFVKRTGTGIRGPGIKGVRAVQ